jgi:hypothetical protein
LQSQLELLNQLQSQLLLRTWNHSQPPEREFSLFRTQWIHPDRSWGWLLNQTERQQRKRPSFDHFVQLQLERLLSQLESLKLKPLFVQLEWLQSQPLLLDQLDQSEWLQPLFQHDQELLQHMSAPPFSDDLQGVCPCSTSYAEIKKCVTCKRSLGADNAMIFLPHRRKSFII